MENTQNTQSIQNIHSTQCANTYVDSIVGSVISKFLERSRIGKEKYGTDLDRTDLSLYEWIVHAQEEHMDAILYLEKIKKTIVKK
jgi:hypothetical protein